MITNRFPYILLVSFIFPIVTSAQDRIITRKNQRIESRILPIRDRDYLYFQMLEDGELKYTLLPKSQVKKIDRNFYRNPIINTRFSTPQSLYHRFSVSARSGIGRRSYMIDPGLPPQIRDFQNRERFGWYNELEASYMFSESFGMHLMYHRFSNSLNRTYQFVNPGAPSQPFDATFRSSQLTWGLNVGLDYYTIFTEKASMAVGISLGTTAHRHQFDYDFFILPTTWSGENLNVMFRIMGQYKLNENLYLNGGLSFMNSSLFRVRSESNGNVEEIDLRNNPLTISRLNLTVGIRYGLNL